MGQSDAAGDCLGHVPVAFPTASVTNGLANRNGESNEFPPTFPRGTPLLPVAHPYPATKPLIQAIEQLQLRRQAIAAHPAAKATSQQRQAMLHRDASTAPGDLADATLESL